MTVGGLAFLGQRAGEGKNELRAEANKMIKV